LFENDNIGRPGGKARFGERWRVKKRGEIIPLVSSCFAV